MASSNIQVQKSVYVVGECVRFVLNSSGYGTIGDVTYKLQYRLLKEDDTPLTEWSGIIPINGTPYAIDFQHELLNFVSTPFPLHSQAVVIPKNTQFVEVPEMCINVKLEVRDSLFNVETCDTTYENEQVSDIITVLNANENWDHIIGTAPFESLLSDKSYINIDTPNPSQPVFYQSRNQVSKESEDYIYVYGSVSATITAWDCSNIVIHTEVQNSVGSCVSYMGSGVKNIFGSSVPSDLKAYQIIIYDGTVTKTFNFQLVNKCDAVQMYFQASNGGGFELFEFDVIVSKEIRTKFDEVCTVQACKSFSNRDHWQKGGFQIHNKENRDVLILERVIDNIHPNDDTFLRSFLSSGNYYLILKNKNFFKTRVRFIPDQATYKYFDSEDQTVLRMVGRIATYYETPNNKL